MLGFIQRGDFTAPTSLKHTDVYWNNTNKLKDLISFFTRAHVDNLLAVSPGNKQICICEVNVNNLRKQPKVMKLVRVISNRQMVRFIVNIFSNRSFKIKIRDGQCSRLRRLRNGLPQGSSLAPLLFTVCLSDIASTTSCGYGYIPTTWPYYSTIEQVLGRAGGNFARWYVRNRRLPLSMETAT